MQITKGRTNLWFLDNSQVWEVARSEKKHSYAHPKQRLGGGVQMHEKMEQVNSQRYSRRGFVSRLAGCLQPLLFPDILNPSKGPGNAILRTTNPPPSTGNPVEAWVFLLVYKS